MIVLCWRWREPLPAPALNNSRTLGFRGLLPKCLLFFCLHPRLGLTVCLSVQGPLRGVWGVPRSPLRFSSVFFLQWCHMINLHQLRWEPLQWTRANTARIARIQITLFLKESQFLSIWLPILHPVPFPPCNLLLRNMMNPYLERITYFINVFSYLMHKLWDNF